MTCYIFFLNSETHSNNPDITVAEQLQLVDGVRLISADVPFMACAEVTDEQLSEIVKRFGQTIDYTPSVGVNLL